VNDAMCLLYSKQQMLWMEDMVKQGYEFSCSILGARYLYAMGFGKTCDPYPKVYWANAPKKITKGKHGSNTSSPNWEAKQRHITTSTYVACVRHCTVCCSNRLLMLGDGMVRVSIGAAALCHPIRNSHKYQR
jgi:hypothetical protein